MLIRKDESIDVESQSSWHEAMMEETSEQCAGVESFKEPLRKTLKRASENLRLSLGGIDLKNPSLFDEEASERVRKTIFSDFFHKKCVLENLVELIDKAVLAEICEGVIGCEKADEIPAQSSFLRACQLAIVYLHQAGIKEPGFFI